LLVCFTVASAFLALLAVLAGCGGANDGLGDSPCVIEQHDSKARISLHNSGYTCEVVKKILLVLPGEIGRWPLRGGSPKEREICEVYPPSSLPLQVKCDHGSRYFTIEAISDLERG